MNAPALDLPKNRVLHPPLDDEPLYEIVDGNLVEIAHMGALAGYFATDLAGILNQFGKQHHIGRAVAETLFRLNLPRDRNRRPDVAFVSYATWPKDRFLGLDQNAWDVTPELAVEVISKHDEIEALYEKLEDYFQAGVKLVWVILPKLALVHVYQSMTDVRILTRGDRLEGGEVLPGFALSLSEFFPEALRDLPASSSTDE